MARQVMRCHFRLATSEGIALNFAATHPPHVLVFGQGSAQADVQKAGFLFGSLNVTQPTVSYQKKASSPEFLLQKLEARGLNISQGTRTLALDYLRGVGAYRLKGYWFHLVDPVSKRFPPGASFDEVLARCDFDRELRAAAGAAIDRLEVAVRAAIADGLSLKHSPHWFLEPSVFKPTREWGMGQLIRKIEEEVRRAEGKRFVEHYFSKYDDPYLPPSWVISECVSFGLWSRTYSILRDVNDKKAISRRFSIDEPDVFKSWIHNLTVIRNLVAHHGQILRVKLGVAPANYKKAGIKFRDQKSFFATATVIQYLLRQTKLPNTWVADLDDIFAKYPSISPSELGFPASWKSEPGWV
jgi:abortive infection bacteriophage resistance protein